MTERSRNRLLLAGLAVLLLGVVLLFTFLGRGEEEPAGEDPVDGAPSDSLGTSADVPLSPGDPDLLGAFEPPASEQGPTPASRIAELFAERYGSYSNQGRYQNLRDLLPVMTASFRAETEAFLATVERSPPAAPEQYEGVTSTQISATSLAYDDAAGTASYDVTLQQVRVQGAQTVDTTYPVLRVTLARVGEAWKVASAEWRR